MPLQPLHRLGCQPGMSSFLIFLQQTPSLPLLSDQTFPVVGLLLQQGSFPCGLTNRTFSDSLQMETSRSLPSEDFWSLEYCVSSTQHQQVLISSC